MIQITKEKVQESNKQLEQLQEAVRQSTKIIKKEEQRPIAIKNNLKNKEDNIQSVINDSVKDLQNINMK